MKYIYAYLITIVLVNLGFSYLPMINTPLGSIPLMSLFVGLVFILRDYAQRSAHNKVLWAMAVGCVLSWLFGETGVVYASVTAFACSELMDWIIYSITKKPFHKRVVISSLCSVPVDSIVFLAMIGVFNPAAMLAMSLSKFTASGILWLIYQYNLIPNLRKTA